MTSGTMHNTSARNWDNMKKPDGSRQVVPFDRDIHFAPVEFLYHDPKMLRQYGERILLFNMNDPATKEAFSTARDPPSLADRHGVHDAEQLCRYYSKVYVQQTHRFQDLEPLFRLSIVSIGQAYEQHLRYPGTGPTPGSLVADTPADTHKTKEVQKDIIIEIVDEVADKIKKKKIEAKATWRTLRPQKPRPNHERP